jgi:hypothetical protein
MVIFVSDTDRPKIILYRTGGPDAVVRPADPRRAWMDATPSRFAMRCLPMVMANQHGWIVECQSDFTATWNGGLRDLDVKIISTDKQCPAKGHFGSGILTFTMPFIVRTPPGWDLLVRGPSNHPKHGIVALEGLVESDTIHETFTMNWRFTAPGIVSFHAGEPFCMLVPQRRGELEQFQIEKMPTLSEEGLHEKYDQWRKSRNQFNRDLEIPGSDARKQGWQREYMRRAERKNQKLAACPFSLGENAVPQVISAEQPEKIPA